MDHRPPLFVIGALGLGLAAALALAETAARALGHEPWTPITHLDDRPFIAMREPDPVKGWRNKPGFYEAPAPEPGGQGSRVRILADGSRATSDQPPAGGSLVALAGGSFIFGQDLSDEETLAWRLQAADLGRRYRNLGVAAYGTYQSLLALEELFASGNAPQSALYGHIDHHTTRNVARSAWVRHLARLSRTAEVKLPYCSLSPRGELVRHRPEGYPRWPLRDRLAVVNLFLNAVRDAWHEPRHRQRDRITELILLEMQRLCASEGAQFVVALLQDEPAGPSPLSHFLRENDIRFVDCRERHTPDLRVDGDRHPNGELNRRWADCVAPALGATD